jgi:hypothetical protein
MWQHRKLHLVDLHYVYDCLEILRILLHLLYFMISTLWYRSQLRLLRKGSDVLCHRSEQNGSEDAELSPVPTAVTMKNVVFWDIKTQFVLHRRHITSPLQSPVG